MRRLFILFAIIVASFSFANPAAAIPVDAPQLTQLGSISSHAVHQGGDCPLVPEAVTGGTVTVDLQYRSSADGNIYIVEGSGDPTAGEITVCPQTTMGALWPNGFYYLHAIVLTSNDNAITTYLRAAQTIQYPDGSTVLDSQFNLCRDDFWLN